MNVDRVSRVYHGEMVDRETPRHSDARIDWLVEHCPFGSILDIGCGEGMFEANAAHERRTIDAIDIRPEAIAQAKALCERTLDRQILKNIRFEVSDFHGPETGRPGYDAVILGEIVEHVREPETFLYRAAYALKHNGKMLVTVPWGPSKAPGQAQAFVLSQFLDALPDFVRWDDLGIVDGHIRFLGTRTVKPGSAGTDKLRAKNRQRFPADLLLTISERAALEFRQISRELPAAHAKPPTRRSNSSDLTAERDALQKQLTMLTTEREALLKQRDELERSKGDVVLAFRTLARLKLIPLVGRVRAYVEARPALKARILRTLPKPVIHKLQKHVRAAIRETTLGNPKRVLIDHKVPEGHDLIVVCNNYPDGGGQYGGEFIRARLLAYRDRGVKCLLVICNHRYSKPHFATHEGIDIFRVPMFLSRGIPSFVAERKARTLFVHSPPPESIEELRSLSRLKKVVLWFHGFEVRDYRRLLFNYSTEDLERQREFLDSANRARMGALLRLDSAQSVATVFVSDFQLDVARTDSGALLKNANVIHNFVDGEFFSFKEKAPEMARKILLIRSFQTRNYANDIATEAIRLLSTRPGFEELSFTIRGTGQYFDELTAPLAHLANVDVAEAYLSANEIKELHDEHGIFLVPSRFDTQGVSMCEAMASGLVCITNPVAAIPEFFDEDCGYFAKADSVEAYADAIVRAVGAPDLFQAKAQAAARRVRSQCGAPTTIERELMLMESRAVVHDE
ncbi:MAG: glycosyltransferase [Rhizobiaceae bacterium]|nr:glycosyltransferase [Rhizobiaceae bacterium]